MPHDADSDRVRERQRATIDDAREAGIGAPEDGVALPVPTYTDTGGVSDLGVDEPVVPKDAQGEHVDDDPARPVTDDSM